MFVMPRIACILPQQSLARSAARAPALLLSALRQPNTLAPSLPIRLARYVQHTHHVNFSSTATRCSAKDTASASSSVDTDPADGDQHADLLRSELELKLPSICCGCGVRLQRIDPDAPGYFQVPKRLLEAALDKQQAKVAAEDAPGVDLQGVQRVLPPSDFDNQLEAKAAAAAAVAAGAPVGVRWEASAAAAEEEEEETTQPDVICARCFSLRHAGRVKSEAAEGMLPEFDLGKRVGRKIHLQKDRRAVVLCVVDITDFDGSLPRLALQSLMGPAGDSQAPPKFKLMVAVNKFDLVPEKATPTRLHAWVVQRLREAGLPAPDKIFMVSATAQMGIKPLMEGVRQALGLRADLWVVGAQNAGKSSLIAAMKRVAGTSSKSDPTIAPLPGTTLGLLLVNGLPLGPKNRAFDTPGVPHSYQLTSILAPAEVRLLLPTKRLRPRTYRIGSGYTILIGGCARVDIVQAPAATIYLSVFASEAVALHCGKTETAEDRRMRHGGTMLQPPASTERLQELGPLVPRDVVVEGDSWQRSSMDVHIAGLGWVGVGLEGQATLRVWTYRSVAVTSRVAMIPDFAKQFERPGFTSVLPAAFAKGASSKGANGRGVGAQRGAKPGEAKKRVGAGRSR